VRFPRATRQTYIKVRGRWMYLYRAIDSNGDTVEFWFSEKRNLTAAKRFLSKALKRHCRPERIVIDGSQTNREAILSCDTTDRLQDRSRRKLKPIHIRQSAYLNNRIEQDDRAIKRRGRMRRELKRLKTYLGRVYRDVARKVIGDEVLSRRLAPLLGFTEHLLTQERTSKNKLYSLHAPEVVCIAKGKAHRLYEFGSKVAVAVTNREGFVLASKALEVNPCDGHTLDATIGQVIALTGVEPERTYVDRGYRGHDDAKKERVFITRQRRGLMPTIKRELRRRSAIEPMIGHMKADGRLGRNHLFGAVGDAMNALLVAAGHNLRLILNWIRLFVAWFLAALTILFAQSDTAHEPWNPIAA